MRPDLRWGHTSGESDSRVACVKGSAGCTVTNSVRRQWGYEDEGCDWRRANTLQRAVFLSSIQSNVVERQ